MRNAKEKLKEIFFYLPARSLPVGAALNLPWRIFYLFFLAAIPAEQRRPLLANEVLHEKKKKVSKS